MEARCSFIWLRTTTSARMTRAALTCETLLKKQLTATTAASALGLGHQINQKVLARVRQETGRRASAIQAQSPLPTSIFSRINLDRKLSLQATSRLAQGRRVSHTSWMMVLILNKTLRETKSHGKWHKPTCLACQRDSCKTSTISS